MGEELKGHLIGKARRFYAIYTKTVPKLGSVHIHSIFQQINKIFIHKRNDLTDL